MILPNTSLPEDPERGTLQINDQTENQFALACDLTAIPPDERPAHESNSRHPLFEVVQEVRELPDGYALRYAAEHFPALASFIAAERLCCPFIAFTFEVAAQRGPIWLRLTGREGVKEFLMAELNR